MKQLATSLEDRVLWGRCLRGYEDAFGTGGLGDPDATSVMLSGELHFTMPIAEWKLRDVWKTTGLSTTHPTSGWFEIENFSHFQVNLTGMKFNRSFFKGDCWVGGVQIYFSNEKYRIERQAGIGNIAAKDIQGLFDAFDKWLGGKLKVTGFDEAIKNL